MKDSILYLYKILFKRKDLLFHKFAAFLISVIFFVTLSACLYNNVMYAKYKSEDVSKINIQLAKKASDYINNEIDDIYKTSIHMAWLPVLDKLMEDTTETSSNYTEQMTYDVSVALRQFYDKLPYIYSIYFYDINKDMVISGDFNVKKSSDYFKYAEIHDNYNYIYYTQMISEPSLFRVLPSSKLIGIGQRVHIIPFATAFPLSGIHKGTIVLNVDVGKFMKPLIDLGKEYGTEFIIMDTDQKNIVCSGNKDYLTEDVSVIFDNFYKTYNGTSKVNISGEDYSAFYSKLSEKGWTLGVLTPNNAFKKQLILNNVKIILISMFILLLSIIISYYFSYRLLKPIINTANNIRSKLNPQIIGQLYDIKDDTVFIEQAVNKLLDSYDKLSSILEEHKSILNDKLLMDIISSEIDGITENNGSKINSVFLDHIFTYHYYIVLLFEIDNYKQIQCNMPLTERKAMRHQIISIIHDNLSKKFIFKCVYIQNGRFLIVINMDTTENIFSDIKQAWKNIKSSQFQYDNITMSAGIGGIHEGIDGVKKSYDEAVNALYHKFNQGCNSIIFAGDIREDSHSSNCDSLYYGFEDEEKLINIMKTASKDELLKTVNELMNKVTDNNADYSKIKYFFSQIITTLLRGLKLMNIKYEDIFEKEYNIYTDLSYCDTSNELRKFTLQQFNKVSDFIEVMKQDKQQNPNASLANKVVQYIKTHYKENISLKELSDEFGYSQSYISIIFKECISENFVDYLNQYRIAIAKDLLKDNNKPIHEVSIEAGYNSDNSFIRIFKKYVGITPGKYREQFYN